MARPHHRLCLWSLEGQRQAVPRDNSDMGWDVLVWHESGLQLAFSETTAPSGVGYRC